MLASAFTLYIEMMKFAMQTSQMMMSSTEVIAHRTEMMRKAMNGEISWTNPEFSKLWQEKVIASMESYSSMTKSMMRQPFSANRTIEHNMTKAIQALSASTRPYSSKANANATRLRRK
jgi:hypothetical protein